MIDYCILIHLSRFTISFTYYTKDSGKFEPYGEGLDRPLAVWFSGTNVIIGADAKREALKGTNNAYYDLFKEMSRQDSFEYSNEKHRFNKLILYTIRAGLKEFFINVMKNYYGEFEEKIATLPLLLIINPDIENNERNVLIRQLKDNGFGNVEEIDENKVILNTYKNGGKDATLILSSNGTDLHGVIFKQKEKNCFLLKDSGKDPRINKLVDLIWARTQAEADWLVKEKELSELKAAALKYIQSRETEYNGSIVFSNGYDYNFYLSKHDLNLYTQQDGARIIGDIIDKVSAYVEKRNCQVVLKNQAASNKFLQDLLIPEFPDLKVIDKDERLLLWNSILDYAKSVNFKFTIEGVSVAGSTNSIGYEPTQEEKRKARILEKGFARSADKDIARQEIREFLYEMHDKGINCFDAILEPLLKSQDETKNTIEPFSNTTSIREKSPLVNNVANVTTAPVSQEPTGMDKRRFKELRATVKSLIANGEEAKAKKEAGAFLDDMHKKRITSFDGEIAEILKSISTVNSSTTSSKPSQNAPSSKVVEPTGRDRRDLKILQKQVETKLIQRDIQGARADVNEFKNAMAKRGISAFDTDIKELTDKIKKSK